MYAFSYFELNTLCIVLMLLILRVHLRNPDRSAAARVFTSLLTSMIVYTGFDFLCGLQENDVLVLPRFWVAVLNVGFFCSSYVTAYLSFIYAEYEMGAQWLASPRKRLVSCIPLCVMVMLTLLTLRFRFFFYIDEGANYCKGPLYVPVVVAAYGYVLLVGIKALQRLHNSEFYSQRRKILTLASFVVFPLIGGTLQAMMTGISIVCCGGTVAMVQVFINLQETRITIDPLTRTNNRTRLEQTLDFYHSSGEQAPFAFLMMDLDRFKEINDRFGHLEGDNALIDFSRVLKQVGGQYSCTLARYGGDEFAVVLRSDATSIKETVRAFEAQLNHALDAYNAGSGKPYLLSVSMGYAISGGENRTVPELVAAADQAMYRVKQARRGAI